MRGASAAAAAAAGPRFDDDGQALSFLPKKGAIYSLAEQIDASDDRSALPRSPFFARMLFCGMSDFFKFFVMPLSPSASLPPFPKLQNERFFG